AVGPVNRRYGRNRNRRSAAPLDRRHHGFRPISIVRPAHHLDDELLYVGACHPFQDRRRMVVLQHENARARRNNEPLGGGGDAVAHRWNDGDVVEIGIDQARGRPAGTLVLLRGERLVEHPWPAFAGYAVAAGLLRGERDRTPGRGIEKAHVARNVEKGALAGQHAMARSVVAVATQGACVSWSFFMIPFYYTKLVPVAGA